MIYGFELVERLYSEPDNLLFEDVVKDIWKNNEKVLSGRVSFEEFSDNLEYICEPEKNKEGNYDVTVGFTKESNLYKRIPFTHEYTWDYEISLNPKYVYCCSESD